MNYYHFKLTCAIIFNHLNTCYSDNLIDSRIGLGVGFSCYEHRLGKVR